jgi:CBS domain-containing protein
MQRAAELLTENGVSGLPVIDADGKLVGVVTEYDLLQLVFDPELVEAPVSQHMSGNVVRVQEDDLLTDLADVFLVNPIRRVPVLSGDKVVGVVSRHDLIRFVQNSRQRVHAQLHH